MTIQLHAQPYDTSATGFYFTSPEDFEAKFEARLPVEEYEIQFIDGEDVDLELYQLADVTQCNLERYFELTEEIYSDDEVTALKYLVVVKGYKLEDALEKYEDVQLYHGKATDWAGEQAEEVYGLEGFALNYFDCESYVNDCKCNGDLVELSYEAWVTNANDL